MNHRKETHAVILFLLREVEGVTETVLGFGAPDKKVGALQWNAPGGRVEQGESVIDALVREMKEEIGIEVDQADVNLGSRLECTIVGEDSKVTYLYMATTRKWEGDPRVTCDEFTKLGWFPIDALPVENMMAGDRYWAERLVHGEYVEGRVCHTTKICDQIHDHKISFSDKPFELV